MEQSQKLTQRRIMKQVDVGELVPAKIAVQGGKTNCTGGQGDDSKRCKEARQRVPPWRGTAEVFDFQTFQGPQQGACKQGDEENPPLAVPEQEEGNHSTY